MPLIYLFFSIVAAQSPVSEDRLNQCYEAHPFFLEALMLISDDDFASGEKSQKRTAQIRIEYIEKPYEIRTCLNDIIQFSKEQYELEDAKYVVFRMSEVSAVVRENSERGGSATKGSTVK